jgi:hypothetical protein
MRRLGGALASITLASILALSALPHADAKGGCPYDILVNRQEGRGLNARVCAYGAVVNWLRVTPGADVSSQAPQGELRDGFTVTIYSVSGRPLVSERVYPLADGRPVAFVPSRTVFKAVTAYPRWVITAGWRTLDPCERVPAALRRLGMPQPSLQP